ncbi:Arc family DNA-binding protein [Agrobacterium sp. CNPSo 2736]|nr:Arc family DNA-binding protein [Agrobacterium sp. CNPSo 2736]RVT80197.1 Arc family DNA-binding protein [Agrobacterium sp. CNPSo 2736]
MTDKKSIQPQDKYVLRLPDGMRERIKYEADRYGRSMNAEIIHRLESTLIHSPEKVQELKWEAEEQAAEISELEQTIVEKDDEIERLKEQMTFYQGMNKSLSDIVQTVIARADIEAAAAAGMRDQLERFKDSE